MFVSRRLYSLANWLSKTYNRWTIRRFSVKKQTLSLPQEMFLNQCVFVKILEFHVFNPILLPGAFWKCFDRQSKTYFHIECPQYHYTCEKLQINSIFRDFSRFFSRTLVIFQPNYSPGTFLKFNSFLYVSRQCWHKVSFFFSFHKRRWGTNKIELLLL